MRAIRGQLLNHFGRRLRYPVLGRRGSGKSRSRIQRLLCVFISSYRRLYGLADFVRLPRSHLGRLLRDRSRLCLLVSDSPSRFAVCPGQGSAADIAITALSPKPRASRSSRSTCCTATRPSATRPSTAARCEHAFLSYASFNRLCLLTLGWLLCCSLAENMQDETKDGIVAAARDKHLGIIGHHEHAESEKEVV